MTNDNDKKTILKSASRKKRIGELILSAGLISAEQLEEALNIQKEEGGSRLGSILLKQQYIKEADLTRFLEEQFGAKSIDLSNLDIPMEVREKVPYSLIAKYQLFPVDYDPDKDQLTIAIADLRNFLAVEDIRFVTGIRIIELRICQENILKETIDRYYSGQIKSEETTTLDDALQRGDIYSRALRDTMSDEEYDEDDEDAEISVQVLSVESEERPIVSLLNYILIEAIRRKASDIHIEPYETMFRIRFRIDGILHDVLTPPRRLRRPIISRIKVLSGMDITQHKVAQDGHLKFWYDGKYLDFRISTLPTIYGENAVIRVLDKSKGILGISKMGFSEFERKTFERVIQQAQGMILVVGPTGSGKTSTLLAIVNHINKIDINITTLEDPIEYRIMGVNQIQVVDKRGVSFVSGLRAILRQDPDVIMIGEIRDDETADIAVKSAMTGHLVISTLHTNGAVETIIRLIDMGVKRYLLPSTLIAVLAQRLVRVLCQDCKVKFMPDPEILNNAGFTEEEIRNGHFFKLVGCPKCLQTGYMGRIGIFELLDINEDIARCVRSGADEGELQKVACSAGMTTLYQSGKEKVLSGFTTIDEIRRVASA